MLTRALSYLESVSLLVLSPRGAAVVGRVGFKNSDWGAVEVCGRSRSHSLSHPLSLGGPLSGSQGTCLAPGVFGTTTSETGDPDS